MHLRRPIIVVATFLLLATPLAQAADELPVVVEENFEQGADRWQPTDAKAWKIEKTDDGQVFSQFTKKSNYEPPHRSPYNIALLKEVTVGDFVLTAKVKSTHEDYPHRDACLFFGYQDPAHFYYVHFGKKADDHANQIFIVNKADRLKISQTSTPGTNWTDAWHHLRVIRDADSGKIAIYFDDMKTPAMTANDTTFTWGQVGVGSFDDTTQWDDIVLRGIEVKK
jgi:hypothetical protein